MNTQDLYLKTADPTGKSSSIISYHRVWDRDLFMKSQLAQHEKKRETPDFRVVSVASEDDYRKFKNYKAS